MTTSIPKFVLRNKGQAGDPGHIHAEITIEGAGWSHCWDGPLVEHFSLSGIVTPERAQAVVDALNSSHAPSALFPPTADHARKEAREAVHG